MTYEQEARGVTPEQRAKIVDIYTHQLANPHGLSMEREKMILDFLNRTPTVYHKQVMDRSGQVVRDTTRAAMERRSARMLTIGSTQSRCAMVSACMAAR